MISLNDFLSCIQQNVARITHYENAGDGSRDGGCDCIGLIIGALALCGFKWPGVHGTNWAARNAMDTLGYINSASDCYPGMIVYKAKEPGDSGYDLPSSYSGSPDQRDYYHVGVVTSTAPLVITHCTGVDGGIKRDSSLGKWRWGGKLKYVDYDAKEEPMNPMYQAIVKVDGNTFPVKMRLGPTTKSSVVASIQQGTVVDVLGIVSGEDSAQEWGFIRTNDQTGYMMRKFLVPADSEPSDSVSGTALAVNRADLETVKTALETALNIIDSLLVG